MPSRNFCTTAELAAELGEADLGVIDASWHLPAAGRIGASEFREGHIPGSVFFDIDTIADLEQGLPHMLPKPEELARAMSALGLGDAMRFVVYDVLGLYAAARVWWTLRAYGVEKVRILEGGLPKWTKEGRPLETGAARIRPPRPFTPRLEESFVASLDEVREALATGSAQVVDARPAERFHGHTPEPRQGLKSGHMPGSLNLPFVEIVEHGRLKPPEALRAAFAEHHVDLTKPIITTCGSGVTAAILALAVEEAGGKVEGLYDGSWAEWGSRDDCQAVTGPA
jgi:thiosulfate/3-mercaptopyruvate sulfurtransferase